MAPPTGVYCEKLPSCHINCLYIRSRCTEVLSIFFEYQFFIDFVVCRLFYFFEVPALCLEKMIQFRKKSDFIMFMNITILFDLGERYSLCLIWNLKNIETHS